MKINTNKFIVKFYKWRLETISDKQFIYLLSIVVGLIVGVAAVLLKNLAHWISSLLHLWTPEDSNYLYFIFPIIGITIVVLFMKYIIKRPSRHGVPSVLHAVSMNRGKINQHNMFSSAITSAITVGFGGSAGLEGPSIVTGAAFGSNIARLFRLEYKHIVLLIGCGSAGVVAAVFNAPIAGLIFVLEVLVLNLSLNSIVPLLLASSSATIMSYFLEESEVLFHSVILQKISYDLTDIPFFIILGVLTGLISVYFKRMYMYIESLFHKIKNKRYKIYIGGVVLGLCLFLFPSLYGEGYKEINMSLNGDLSYIFDKTIFSNLSSNVWLTIILFVAIIFVKVIATAVTFGAGGVGGVFAPSLFIGANVGFLFFFIFNHFSIHTTVSVLVLLGMAGMISGVLHAPLTGMFLIADITSGYQLFVPLMLVSSVAYLTVRMFEKHSVYTALLAKRKQLLSHNKDASVLTMLNINKLIEKNFSTVDLNASLGELVKVIKVSRRNIFPVIDEDGVLHGIVKLDDIRNIMFDTEMYRKISVREIMQIPEYFFSPEDHMDEVVKIIQKTKHYNFPVLKDGVYIGFISRATVFSEYRKMSAYFSEE